ncbi:MAG: glycerophosphodiester phosphodiesterase [Deltaproteobacteria bacterium]|nr:glycerophosphodiester phosphodiesterase [Deltaproteobacteria bacterium]MBW2363027.1 glycerophosphodiester phosphodiesterase [Deltaproteobacteria bacterium]
MRIPLLLCLALPLAFAPHVAAGEVLPGFDVQAHRGARGLAPENTLVGFARALALGVTTLELDVGVTRDGRVVVAHDPFVNPKLCLTPTGEPFAAERGPLLRDLDLREIRAFDCGSLNPDAGRFPEPPRRNAPGEPMPSLRDVFELVRDRGDTTVRFNVEVKSWPGSDDTVPLEAFVRAVVEVLRSEKMLVRTTLQAFEWRALALAKQLEPRLRTAALLAELDPAWQAGLDAGEHGGVLGLLRAVDGYVDAFSPHWTLLLEGEERYAGASVAAYQAAGFPVVPWTVNEPERMRQLIALGVDGIITDYPDRLIEVLQGLAGSPTQD